MAETIENFRTQVASAAPAYSEIGERMLFALLARVGPVGDDVSVVDVAALPYEPASPFFVEGDGSGSVTVECVGAAAGVTVVLPASALAAGRTFPVLVRKITASSAASVLAISPRGE